MLLFFCTNNEMQYFFINIKDSVAYYTTNQISGFFFFVQSLLLIGKVVLFRFINSEMQCLCFY